MHPASARRILQWLHIAGSVLVGTYLYSPWSSETVFRASVLYAVFPAMGLRGLWMWQGPRIGRLLGVGSKR